MFVGLEFFLKYFITPEVKNRFVLPNPRFYKLKNIRRYIDNIFLSPDTKPAATAENDNKSDADNGIKRKTVGVGIGNIAYRIKGMYNNSGIKIYSVKERGTVIQIFFDNYSK